jgi:TetR/AcrR family transcriptional regulator, cholesterol catabolism regulator
LQSWSLIRCCLQRSVSGAALRRVADPEFLTTEYLSLRLQLWALGQAHEAFAHINTAAQKRYRAGLAALIRTARPGLSRAECDKRAADIDILQNGMWLTALLGLDRASIRRTVARSEEIALALVDVGEEIAERGASLSALSAPGA